MLIALILLISVIPGLTALGFQKFQVKLGLYGPILPLTPHLEVSVLTSSFGNGFSQELGFRVTGIPDLDRVVTAAGGYAPAVRGEGDAPYAV